MAHWDFIAAAISDHTQNLFHLAHAEPLSGGCINQAWRISSHEGVSYFVKLSSVQALPMLAAESAGLLALEATHSVRVPQVVTYGTAGEHGFLVLEYLDLKTAGDSALLGTQLAALHRAHAPQFGFSQDNTLGRTAQHNARCSDWVQFWREQRLGWQLDLAAHNGYGGELQKQGKALLDKLPEFFTDYHPAPSLLHGDLWAGNHAYLDDGTPVIFDPAPYYGDREADLAMTELFGGYGTAFYAAYRAAYPLDAGYARRKTLYNLYHILNHANLFGGGYAHQAQGMMQKLLAQGD